LQREEAEKYNEMMLASTVASALERNLDRELYSELTAGAKEGSALITRICNDHSDNFLGSVGRLVSLGSGSVGNAASVAVSDASKSNPSLNVAVNLSSSAELKSKIEASGTELVSDIGTGGTMLTAASKLESMREAHRRAKAMKALVANCHRIAVLLERGRKYAALSRPRAALDAVDEARACLKKPLNPFLARALSHTCSTPAGAATFKNKDNSFSPNGGDDHNVGPIVAVTTIEATPFGVRANELLPKIENEVLAGARKGLARWFLNIRGGEGASAGAAALRKCANSMAAGASMKLDSLEWYSWQNRHADNLISRGDGRVATSARVAYSVLYTKKDMKRLEGISKGVGRKAEAFASAFGWYRCWKEDSPLNLEASAGGIKSAVTSTPNRRLTSFRSGSSTQWSKTLVPPILFDDGAAKRDDEAVLLNLPEAVYPVHRAKATFTLLGKGDEFRSYYEQNRFGDMKIQGGKGSTDLRSSLSSLTGDDVSVGTDRFFNAKILPHLCASIVGFSAVEAALELGHFDNADTEKVLLDKAAGTKKSLNDADKKVQASSSIASSQYERALIAELGLLLRSRANGATLAEIARASYLMSILRAALRMVYPSSATRRFDKELLAMDNDMVMTGLRVCYDEQKAAAMRAAIDDRFDPVMRTSTRRFKTDNSEELVNFPFGLSDLYRESKAEQNLDSLDPSTAMNKRAGVSGNDDSSGQYCFSQCIPVVLRTIHARVLTFAHFVCCQEELGQKFASKKGSGAAGYVFDCLEECVKASAISLKESVEEEQDEVPVTTAIQMTANISALSATLPRLFGTVMRGLCQCGLVKADSIEETFAYADEALKRTENSCENEGGSMYSLVYEVSRNKIDVLMNFSLENFNWVAKSTRTTPNTYAESLIEYMKTTFSNLTPLDEGSRAGIHFSCCGYVAERLVRLLTDSAADGSHEEGLPPINKIDAFGIKNLSVDVEAMKKFANTSEVPQLVECFSELDCLTSAMLDRDLPMLLQPSNQNARRRKYPFLSLDKLGNILEKYVGTGLGSKFLGGGGSLFAQGGEFLMLEKKDVVQLLRVVREQTH